VTNKTENNCTDQYLISKVLSGDTNAFGAIIKATERLVTQIVFKMIPNTEDRKDIAQDIYLKVFNKLSGFKYQAKLSTWIAQIAYNTCLDYLAKRKLVLPGELHETAGADEDAFELMGRESLFTTNTEMEKTVIRKELAGILQSEIEKLPPVYKTLVSLYHNEELSYEEIAQITALPGGTVKSYLFRARKALKESLLLHYKKEEL
jgi:RNA polymerase sigma-70 factor (ECF subfamily)